MKELIGRGVSNGIAIGKLYFFNNTPRDVPEYKVDDVKAELERYRSSLAIAKKRLQDVYDNACKRISKNESVIFQTHIMILEDSKFIDLVENSINEGRNAEFAVISASNKLASIFKAIDDEYFKARYTDIIDAGHILYDVLSHRQQSEFLNHTKEPVIIAADDLLPSDTMSFNKDTLLGFIINEGSQNSHSAMLARTLGVPSVIQVNETLADYNGMPAIIDGQVGRVIINPDTNVLALYTAKRERYIKQQNRLKRQIGLPSETKNKQYIKLSADICRLDEIEKAKTNDAESIGLFRSEYLFMNREKCPSESEQFETYKTVLKQFGDKDVVITTFNGGSGKGVRYLDIPKEKNPALGFRGIRISLENPEFFRTQLRALFRASAYGKLSIVLPMISSIEEIEYANREADRIISEMKLHKLPFRNDVKRGVMIETPAAAIISDEICKRTDFVIINTDNLVQYTLAMDKENQKLDDFFRPYHPAVKKLIKMTVDNAHRAGKKVAVCGELASDTSMTEFFLALRVDELISIPSKLLKIKALVRETDTSDAAKLIGMI